MEESNRKHIKEWIKKNEKCIEECNQAIIRFMFEKEFAEKNLEILKARFNLTNPSE